MRNFWKILSAAAVALCAGLFALALWGAHTLPDSFTTVDGSLPLNGMFTAGRQTSAHAAFASGEPETANDMAYDVKLFRVIPVKTVNVQLRERRYLAVGGELVGVKLKTKGVLVVGTETFTGADGKNASPAAAAGIKKGDTILTMDGAEITGNDMLISAIEKSGGAPLTLTLERNGEIRTVTLTPQKTSATGAYKGGLWVRDSTVGVGTLTFCDIENGQLAALGHGIYDTDTAGLLKVSEGDICTATVSSVKKGAAGAPGEITGALGPNTLGSITANAEDGIYGELCYMESAPELYPVATASEVHTGPAQMICTVTDGEKQTYDIEITRVNGPDGEKNMTVKITDRTLLSLTGGIVQGMSGSPILQDGMLAGAVTHVFVNDPRCGYAIFAQTMLEHSDRQ